MRDIGVTALSLDQFEALRLCDHENLDQEAAGERMGISRGTVQRLLYSGRRQIIDAILENHALVINLKEGEDENVDLHTNQGSGRARRHDK